MDAPRLLLVDDDRALGAVLRVALEEEGFEVTTAHDGREGLRQFEAVRPDLVVLDVLMPEMDGLEVCRRIRKTSQVPILLLTSRGEEVDKVTGLDSGADDYVTKPFSTRELCARLRALSRRVATPSPNALGAQAGVEGPVVLGQMEVDPSRAEARWGGRPVPLTRSELLVLLALARQPGVVLGRDRLIDLARGADVVVTDRTVDSYIKRIRKKFREVDPAFDAVETVIGVGYRYRVA